MNPDVAALRQLRDVLDDAGYAADRIGALLHIPGELRITGHDATRAELLLDETRPLDALVRLFLLDGSLATATVVDALGAEAAELLFRAGLAAAERGDVRARVLLVPHGDLIVASDPFGHGDRHWVPGVQRPSDLLACVTPRRHVRSALDLGTGNGIQALLLSRHADHVVAVDINEHALDLARINAVLNGCDDRIEFREGNFFEPVRGERFDLVVSNPPYVLSPEDSYVFRDADVRGDVMCRDLIAEMVGHLTADGLGVVMVSWAQHGDEPPAPQQWLTDAGADGVVSVLAVLEALDAAMTWNAPHLSDPDEFASRVGRWREYFAEEDIPAIGHGVVAARPTPAGTIPATAVLPATAPPGRRGGDQLERIVRSVSARGVAPAAVAIAADARVTATSGPLDGRLATSRVELGVPDGLSFTVGLDAAGARLIQRLAAPTSLADAVDSFPDLTPAGRAQATDFLGQLLRLGLLVPVDDARN